MAAQKTQRIKLRIEGSPVKFDGTILKSSVDGKRITVEFDGPLPTTELFAYSDMRMVSNMKTVEGQETTDTKLMAHGQWWEVL